MIGQIDRTEPCEAPTMPGEPAFGRIALAILLFRSVLARNKFRRQQQNLGGPRRLNTGVQEGMKRFRAAIGAAAMRATMAADLARTEILCAIERGQQPAVHAMKPRRAAHRRKRIHRLDEQPVKHRGRIAVQHLME